MAGLEHGVGEIGQGDTAPDGLMLESWAGSELFEALAGEPAMTLAPTLLVAGILTALAAIVLLVWVTVFIEREHGALVLVALSTVLLLVGGGFGPPLLGIILSVAAGRMNASPPRHARPGSPRPLLSRVWPWSFGAGVIAWLSIFPGTVLAVALFGPAATAAIEGALVILILAAFALLVLALVAASARDAEGQRGPQGAPALSGRGAT